MVEFLLSILVFLAAHILPAATGLRALLIARAGRRVYIAGYSLVSIVAVAWVISAAQAAPYFGLWPSSRTTALVPLIAMLPASVLLAAGVGAPNPLSVSFRSGLPEPRKAGLVVLLRHPILWAFFLWSGSHLVANGDLVSCLLFGAMAVFSLAGMKRLERRARERLPAADYAAAMALTGGGLATRLKRVATPWSVVQILAGTLLYLALLHLHGPVIGIDPLAYL